MALIDYNYGIPNMAIATNVTNQPDQKSLALRFAPLIVLLGGLALGYAFGLHHYLSLTYLGEQRGALQAYVADHKLFSALIFMVVYAAVVAFSFPAASVLTIFGGFLFGWLQAGIMVAFAATLGATILFIAAKSSFGGFLRAKLKGSAASFADGFAKNALNYLFVLRLAPVFPFFLVNIAPALFNVRTRDYVIATFFGILPGTFAYCYLGEGVGSVLDAAAASGTTPSVKALVTPEITIAFAALAFVAAIPTLVRWYKGSK